jgi:hypothetical protein
MRTEDVNRLIKAAEQALKYFEDAMALKDTEVVIKEALRQALGTAIERALRMGRCSMQP